MVAFQPKANKKTLYRWGWLDRDPETDAGIIELKEFMERELRGARVFHLATGAIGFASGPEEKLKKACHVLKGRRAYWFCEKYRKYDPFAGLGPSVDEVLLIKYVGSHEHSVRLHEPNLQRLVPRIDAVADAGTSAITALASGRPSWSALLESVYTGDEVAPHEQNFERATTFFLELQEVQLKSRTYPFVRVSENGLAREVEIRYDRERDDRRIRRHRSGMFPFFAEKGRWRASFGDHFADEESDVGLLTVLIYEDIYDTPNMTKGPMNGFYLKRRDEDNIVVRADKGSIPATGWIMTREDKGSSSNLRRQVDAQREFLAAKGLLQQLDCPTTVVDFAHRWRHVKPEQGPEHERLLGDAPKIIRAMLGTHPFYALQGPPGTGKTTVAARAIRAYLEAEPGARILVSAQSNDALDHLAIKIREELAGSTAHPVAIRFATDASDDRVDSRLNEWKLDRLADRTVERIHKSLTLRLERKMDPEELRPILGEWRGAVRLSHLEIRDRIQRGANLIFATCAAATARNVGVAGSFGAFDWVLVEEAAKAWPTELAIPLVRGFRWTLIGDQNQLPAHRREEVDRFLGDCVEAPDEELSGLGKASKDLNKVFDLFGWLFDNAPHASQGLAPAVGYLGWQFRMRKPIADVVSRAFYRRQPLKTNESPEYDSQKDPGLRKPRQLAGEALVWIDTTGLEWCRDDRWSNEGEARVVSRLLQSLEPSPLTVRADPKDALAVLTPYRAQVNEMLRHELPLGCGALIHTVHEFQGREADVVVASLVRDQDRGSRPDQKLGHVASPQLANVLFSRAKGLLVVVGSFRHFRSSGVDFWETICAGVEELGKIVPVARSSLTCVNPNERRRNRHLPPL